MGRNAKLRAGRNRETERLTKRHRDQDRDYREGVRTTCALHTDKLFSRFGLEQDSPALQEKAEKAIQGLSPQEFTQLYGTTWAQLILSNVDSIDGEMKSTVLELALVPESVAKGFMAFQGMTMFRMSAHHDCPRLRQFVIDLAGAPALQEGLKACGLGIHSTAPGLRFFEVMNGACQQWAARLNDDVLQQVISREEAQQMVEQFIPLNDHIESAADLACGRVLCDAGDLVLHFRRAERLQDAELCLSFRSPDGLLGFFPTDQKAPVSVKAVRTLRRFVDNYKGPKMAGEISSHPQAARLCRLIGLTVRNGHGFLGGRN